MIVALAAQRESDADGQPAPELVGLLENIAEVAGDAIESHESAERGNRPRRERVFRAIVEEIAVFFCDEVDTHEGAFFVEEGVRDVLREYGIQTTDAEGQKVTI